MHFISEFTQKAVCEVFSTMLGMEVQPGQAHEGESMPPAESSGIVGSVGFAGKINGAIYMSYTDPLAKSIVCQMIGESPGSVEDPEVADVIGELANMVAGDMKRRTSEKGYNGLLVPPVIMVGNQISIEPNGSPITLFHSFKLPGVDDDLQVRVYARLEG